ncbi:hypothetical protein OS493_005482 [Desmophyllum pertusum]|uniref:Uncharacterized protein n=1 Tax=Desmophyllum pertusum TaxID=174260 RepID=A0A9W9YSC4_9CNID|nr:hypothetical protein OS493_005482 [Desmophyllum pertusum]
MNLATALTFKLVSFIAILSSIAATSADQGLHLKSYSEEQVEGCYLHNQTLGVCFDIRKGLMKVIENERRTNCALLELGPEMFFYQVLDQAFIGHGASMVYVPNDVPRIPDALRAFLKTHLQEWNDRTRSPEKSLPRSHERAALCSRSPAAGASVSSAGGQLDTVGNSPAISTSCA